MCPLSPQGVFSSSARCPLDQRFYFIFIFLGVERASRASALIHHRIWQNAHSPDKRCSGCSHTCTWKRQKVSVDNCNAVLRGQVNWGSWLGLNWPTSVARTTLLLRPKIFQQQMRPAEPPLHSWGPQKLYQLAGILCTCTCSVTI